MSFGNYKPDMNDENLTEEEEILDDDPTGVSEHELEEIRLFARGEEQAVVNFNMDRPVRCRDRENFNRLGFFYGVVRIGSSSYATVLWDEDKDPVLYNERLIQVARWGNTVGLLPE